MRWALVLVVACAAPAAQPVANRPPPAPPPNLSMIDQIVRAELEHAQADPTWLPESKGLAGPVFVLRDLEVGQMANDRFTSDVLRITAAALPPTFSLMTKDALQAEADRRGHEVAFIALSITSFAGVPDVHVGFGLRMTKGPQPCGAIDLFANRDGHWKLTKRRARVCN